MAVRPATRPRGGGGRSDRRVDRKLCLAFGARRRSANHQGLLQGAAEGLVPAADCGGQSRALRRPGRRTPSRPAEGARLLAPIKQVSTRKGEFQVWSHPTTDKATTSIPLDLTLGPHEAHSGTVARASEGHVTAWLFLSGDSDPGEVSLELAVLDEAGHLRRYRFAARHEPAARR